MSLGCTRSWTWKSGPNLKSDILRVLGLWFAFRGHPSALARLRQTQEYAILKKKETVERALDDLVCLVAPWKLMTIMCDWNQEHLAVTYERIVAILGGTVLATKTLYFLVPDLFVILDRKQSYPPLRKELPHLPKTIEIDNLDGQSYAAILSYVRSEIDTLITKQKVVVRKGGATQNIANLDQFRNLSPRHTRAGAMRPGTICKVVDDIFAD